MSDRQHVGPGRLVVVSNRLPVVLTSEHGRWKIEPGSGGLVTALAPVLRDRGGLWIGWPGTAGGADVEKALREHTPDIGYSLVPVTLSREEVKKHYRGFSNEVIWPLFHDLQSRCNFDPDYWKTYQEVNRKFARTIVENTGPDDFVWIHDYHLMLVAAYLREEGFEGRLGFFLHIPFPPLDLFVKLPWRSEVLRALLSFDLIGVQTLRDRRNFMECLRRLIGDVWVKGRGPVCDVRVPERRLRVGAFPISIDFAEFERETQSREVAESAWLIHENLPERQIVLGIDRLDYTKGIPSRLEAFRCLLERYTEHLNNISLVQVVVPSRRGIPEYEELKTEIEQLVGKINGQFTHQSGWIPIHYIHRSLSRYELLGYYRAAEIALLTPIKDGMNLVAKEYCASKVEEDGVLVLSEFAGAAPELQDAALLVNPYDVEGMADTLHRALTMDDEDREARMRKLRQTVRRHDIFWWVDSFLRASVGRDLEVFPRIRDYTPVFPEALRAETDLRARTEKEDEQ